MKKGIGAIVLFFAGIVGVFLGVVSHNQKQNPSLAITLQTTPTTAPSPTSLPPSIGIPISFTIPSLHVTTAIESVGMDNQGRMDVPKNVTDVAWYDLGYRPGQKGSAVIDGHYDTQTGAPAVFYNISKLTPGDTIVVQDDKGNTYTFTVTQNTNYPYNSLPLNEIFASNDRARLNLITCSGVWDHVQHNYSTRDVVYAELTSTTNAQ